MTTAETKTPDEIFRMVDEDHDAMGLSMKERRKWWRRVTRRHTRDLLAAMLAMLEQADRRRQWIDPDRFVLRGRSGGTNPQDINHAALLHSAVKLVPPLSNNGQCSKDVAANATSLNRYTTNLRPPYRNGLETVKQYVQAMNEQCLAHTNFRIIYLGDDA